MTLKRCPHQQKNLFGDSQVPGHRTLALRLIAAVLENAARGLQMQEVTSFGNQGQEASKDVDWQAIWAYALGPEPGLTLTLRYVVVVT